MKSNQGFIVGGYSQWRVARLAELKSDVAVRYEQELATATWFERLRIEARMRREVRRQLLSEAPSPYTLW